MEQYLPFIIQSAATIVPMSIIMMVMLSAQNKSIHKRIDDLFVEKDAREGELRSRERMVIAAALESELLANKTKLDAFLMIYHEMVRAMREQGKTPKYRLGGEVIHERPSLSRNIFDAYVTRLELFGPVIAGELSQLYAQIGDEPEYKTLNPDMPADQVIALLERILSDAKNMLIPIEKNIGALNVIIRSKKRITD